MTLTLEIPDEAYARFEAAAQAQGQATGDYVRESFLTWLALTTPDTEKSISEEAML